MIQRLKEKNLNDIYEFLLRIPDRYDDLYITQDRERKFLKGNRLLIEKLLKYQEVYGLFHKELKGVLIVLHEKGFRPYIKILTENSKYNIDFLKFLKWNFLGVDLYCKFKKDNPISNQILRTGFAKIGDRGKEVLFFKKGIKVLHKLIPKDSREE